MPSSVVTYSALTTKWAASGNSTSSNGRWYVQRSISAPVKDSPVGSQPSPSAFSTSGSRDDELLLAVRHDDVVTPGCAATAVLETRVHGVVVHTSSDGRPASGPEVSGKRTYTEGSTIVS